MNNELNVSVDSQEPEVRPIDSDTAQKLTIAILANMLLGEEDD